MVNPVLNGKDTIIHLIPGLISYMLQILSYTISRSFSKPWSSYKYIKVEADIFSYATKSIDFDTSSFSYKVIKLD